MVIIPIKFFKIVGFITSFLFLLSSCGSTLRSHPYVDLAHYNNHQTEHKSKQIYYDDPAEVCALLAMPGDFVLSHMSGTGLGKAAYQPFLFPIMFLELADLNDPFTKYFHAEIITGIDSNMKIRTRGFYPFSKRYIPNMFHDSYSVYRVRGAPGKQEAALIKIEKKDYPGFGVCSDYVAWAYDGKIYSWWNVIPLLRDVLVRVYPPEALQTSDDLANSPQTVKICEVRKGKLVYPDMISTEKFLKYVLKCEESSNSEIRHHAQNVLKMLLFLNYIDTDHHIVIDEIVLNEKR